MSRLLLLTLFVVGGTLAGCRAEGALTPDVSDPLADPGPERAPPLPANQDSAEASAPEPLEPALPVAAPSERLEAAAAESSDSAANEDPQRRPHLEPQPPRLAQDLATQRDALGVANARFKRPGPTAQQGSFGQALPTEIRALKDEVERLANALDAEPSPALPRATRLR